MLKQYEVKKLQKYLIYLAIFIIALFFLGKTLMLPLAFAIISGRSMEPTLKFGDMVIAFATYIKSYSVGDIVIWCKDTLRLACVLHRVVEIREDTVVTKGDFNPAPDPPIPKRLIYYVAVAFLPSYIWIPMFVVIIGLVLIGDKYYKHSS